MEITMYTMPGCRYCDHAKNLFERANLDYKAFVVGKDITRSHFLDLYPMAHGYPYIIIDGVPVPGGLYETAKILVDKGLIKTEKK